MAQNERRPRRPLWLIALPTVAFGLMILSGIASGNSATLSAQGDDGSYPVYKSDYGSVTIYWPLECLQYNLARDDESVYAAVMDGAISAPDCRKAVRVQQAEYASMRHQAQSWRTTSHVASRLLFVVLSVWVLGLAWRGFGQRAFSNRGVSGAPKCPHCAERVKPEAVVCRWCGRDLVTAS